jgi:hypothetical protein
MDVSKLMVTVGVIGRLAVRRFQKIGIHESA